MKNIFKKNWLLIFEIIFVLFLSLVNLSVKLTDGHFAFQNLLTGDGATFTLISTSHNLGLGVPYKDYWEYRPPGFFMLLDFWSRIFSTSILSMKMLEVLFRVLVGLEIIFISRKIFPKFQALFITLVSLILFFSPVFGIWLYPEAYGIFFSLLGLICLLYIKKLSWRLFLASLFFSFAFQLKDVFGGVFLSFAPFFLYAISKRNIKQFFQYLIYIFLPLIMTFMILWLYLNSLNIVDSYLNVLRFKSDLYPLDLLDNTPRFINRYFSFIWNDFVFITNFKTYKIAIFYIIIFILLIRKLILKLGIKDINNKLSISIPSFKILVDHQSLNLAVVIFFACGAFIGPSLMVFLSPHYVFPTIIPFILLGGMITMFLSQIISHKNEGILSKIIFLLIFLLLFTPRKWLLESYRDIQPLKIIEYSLSNITLPEGDLSVEKYINSKTQNNDCIVSVYGWKSPEMYLYAKRKPCTRFILPNIVITDWQKKEYSLSIINNPPKAIIYSTGGADMDIEAFEKEVINYPKVLANCYLQDMKYTNNARWNNLQIFFAKYENDKQKECLKNNIL